MPNTEEVELVDTITGVSSVGVRPMVNDHLPKQKPGQVTIGGNTYRLPSLGRMNRAGVKRLTPLLAKVSSDDAGLEAMWELADALLAEVPSQDIDELTIDDLKALFTAAGMLSFSGEDAPDPENLTITLGESSASTGS